MACCSRQRAGAGRREIRSPNGPRFTQLLDYYRRRGAQAQSWLRPKRPPALVGTTSNRLVQATYQGSRLHTHQVIHSNSTLHPSSPLPCQVCPRRSSVQPRLSTSRPPPPNMNRTLPDAMEFALRSAYVNTCNNSNSTSIPQNYSVLPTASPAASR